MTSVTAVAVLSTVEVTAPSSPPSSSACASETERPRARDRSTHANATPVPASSSLESLDKCCESAVSTFTSYSDVERQSVLEEIRIPKGVPGATTLSQTCRPVQHPRSDRGESRGNCAQVTAASDNLQVLLQAHLNPQSLSLRIPDQCGKKTFDSAVRATCPQTLCTGLSAFRAACPQSYPQVLLQVALPVPSVGFGPRGD